MLSEYLPLDLHKVKKKAIYAGSFDPLTLGHIWLIQTASKLFDELIVAIGENPDKKYTFSHNDRLDMLTESISALNLSKEVWIEEIQVSSPQIKIDSFQNKFLFDYAAQKNASFIVRGIRNVQDFEYERMLQNVNIETNSDSITTIFLVPPKHLADISSSVVKAICGPENWENIVAKMVPEPVLKKLIEWKK